MLEKFNGVERDTKWKRMKPWLPRLNSNRKDVGE